jgi:predicted enzyme related to lactoylglutathione lyase
MIIGIQNIHLYVKDMDRAVKFYTEAFGAKVVFGSEYWTSLSCFGLIIGLHGNENQEVISIPYDDHGAKAGATLTFKSNNISQDRENLEKCGAKIISQFNADWGELLVFQDPDGNILNLQHPSY